MHIHVYKIKISLSICILFHFTFFFVTRVSSFLLTPKFCKSRICCKEATFCCPQFICFDFYFAFVERNSQKLDMTNELFAIKFLYNRLNSSPTHLGNALLLYDLNTRFSLISATNKMPQNLFY